MSLKNGLSNSHVTLFLVNYRLTKAYISFLATVKECKEIKSNINAY